MSRRRRLAPALAGICTACFLAGATYAGTTGTARVSGRADLRGPDGSLAPAGDTVLWIPGAPPSSAAAPSIESRQKRFSPHVVAVTSGSAVSFPNVDPIYHNVFSRSEGNAFDLGLYRRGAARSFRFNHPGLVRIYCNIHPDMAAYVMVLDEAAFTVSKADGTFALDGIPPGTYVLHVWNERSGETTLPLTLGPGDERALYPVLDGSEYRPEPHKNKHGRDYPPVTDDVDRY